MLELGFEPIGNHLLISSIPFALLGLYFAWIGGPYIFSWVNFTLAAIVLVLGAWNLGALGDEVAYYFLMVETFVTLLIPCFMVLFGFVV